MSDTLGWSKIGWCAGGSGSNTSRPTPESCPDSRAASAASRSSSPPRPQLIRTAPGLARPRNAAFDHVVVLRGQRHVQGQHVARGDQLVQVAAGHLGGRRGERVVGEHPHPERRGQLTDAAADPAVADDPDRRAVQVAGRAARGRARAHRPSRISVVYWPSRFTRAIVCAITPSATAPVPLPGVTTTAMPRAVAVVEVDQVGADPGAGEHAHPRCAVEERLVDHRVGAHDRALGDGQVGVGGLGDERRCRRRAHR